MELPGNLALELQMLGQSLLEKGVMIYEEGFKAGVLSVPSGVPGGKSDEEVAQLISDALAAQKAQLKEAAKAVISDDAAALDSVFA